MANIQLAVASPTDNAIARYDTSTNHLLQDSLVTIDDSGNIVMASTKTVDGRDVSVDGTALDALGAKLHSAYVIVSSALTTGTTQPISLTDATFSGFSAGGLAGPGTGGTAGVIAGSFASSGAETGTGSGQGGLSSTPNSNQPYNTTDFPGGRFPAVLVKSSNGGNVLLRDVLSTAVLDLDAQVVLFLARRTDLGSDLKWRGWFYYKRASDGLWVSFTPNASLTNVLLYVPNVSTDANEPTAAGMSGVAGIGASELTFGVDGDIQSVGTASTGGTTGKTADAGHVHALALATINTLVGTPAEPLAETYPASSGADSTGAYAMDDHRHAPWMPNNFVLIRSDFAGQSNTAITTNDAFVDQGLYTSISGTGAQVVAVASADSSEVGVNQLSTGTTTTGSTTITARRGSTGNMVMSSGAISFFDIRVKVPTLSTSGERFKVRAGFSAVSFTDGYWFEYDEATDSHWRIMTNKASAGPTGTNSSITVNAGQNYRLTGYKLAGSTTAHFFIDGVEVGTGQSTNFPDTVGLSIQVDILKSAGTTARTLNCDWIVAGFVPSGGSRAS